MSVYPQLGQGSSGPEVQDLQNNLNVYLASQVPGFVRLVPDGLWGSRTTAALQQASSRLGLGALAVTTDAFYDRLLNALDRIDPATGTSKPVIRMDPLEITGKVSAGTIAFGLLAILAFWKLSK